MRYNDTINCEVKWRKNGNTKEMREIKHLDGPKMKAICGSFRCVQRVMRGCRWLDDECEIFVGEPWRGARSVC